MKSIKHHQATQFILFTDLDGTLLDHDTYSFNAAKQSLQQLHELGIPVILNSSKTADEISSLRKALNNTHPFIIENGSAILIPKDAPMTPANVSAISIAGEPLDCLVLGQVRDHALKIIQQVAQTITSTTPLFTQYHHCSAEDIAQMTGLTLAEAKQSAQRYYTEPLQWLGSDAQKSQFIHEIKQQGLQVLQGGRFLHVMGLTDKGKANTVLAQQYQQQYSLPITTIALGDSHNDIAMLECADIAVVIKSPYHAPPEFTHPRKIMSTEYGPKGWHECVQQLLSQSPFHNN